jgi:phosphatidylserine/phosphatidylglycerophosphate/cardiolipin synthase-like enzyme
MTSDTPGESLADRVAEAALEIDASVLMDIVEVTRSVPNPRSARRTIEQRVSGPTGALIQEVFGDGDDVEIATVALEAAALAASAVRSELGKTTTIWTGPNVASLPVRPTRQAVLQLIARARKALTLVTFAGYDIDQLVEALESARKDHGVAVRIILETSLDSGGKMAGDPAAAFGNLPKAVPVYRWPAVNRGLSGASMHVKTVIRDSVDILVSSANLTGAALDRNMELGLLVEGGPIAATVDRHFDELIEADVLVRMA